MRTFVNEEIMPHRDDWDKVGKIPEDLYVKAGKLGILSAICGWPEELTSLPRPQGFDGFFSLITMDELSRCGSGGIVWGLVGGFGVRFFINILKNSQYTNNSTCLFYM